MGTKVGITYMYPVYLSKSQNKPSFYNNITQVLDTTNKENLQNIKRGACFEGSSE
ncbi:hypothetical protein Scep_025811 [Stephania cephalantha]|uniref:Uncharacterized protein n=1 Tax=Stephania cephalantha TaxID=152367 RepID=A0AAP0EM75_9MAGN